MTPFMWFLLGCFAGGAPMYQLGYSRGMDWVWLNIVTRESARETEANAK
jgi:hypothetical protein